MLKKSIKLKKNYWDSSAIVHRKKYLKEILDDMRKPLLIGIYPLITRNVSGSNANNLLLEERYNFKEQLLLQYPENENYIRKYILQITVNTHTSILDILIDNIKILEVAVWGSNSVQEAVTITKDVTEEIMQLKNGHLKITATCASWFYINQANLLIYETLRF